MMRSNGERWQAQLFWCLLAFLIGIGVLAFASVLRGQDRSPLRELPLKATDFRGTWKMDWRGMDFRQVFRADGTSDCIGTYTAYFGSWTSLRNGQVTVSETLFYLPSYDRGGDEITFTLDVKRAERAAGKVTRIELEGEYLFSTVKVVLTPFED